MRPKFSTMHWGKRKDLARPSSPLPVGGVVQGQGREQTSSAMWGRALAVRVCGVWGEKRAVRQGI
jgi:hypothetical protein